MEASARAIRWAAGALLVLAACADRGTEAAAVREAARAPASPPAELRAPPRAGERVPIPPEAAPAAAETLPIHVRVVDPLGRPASATVRAVARGGASDRATCDAEGRAVLRLPSDAYLTEIEAVPTDAALARHQWLLRSAQQDDWRGFDEVRIELRPGGTLRLRATHEGRPLPYQVLRGDLESADVAGLPRSFDVATDESGSAVVPQVLAGAWSVLGEEGRGFEITDRRTIVVEAGRESEAAIEYEAVPASACAVGVCASLAGAEHDELFRLRRYVVRCEGRNALEHVYADGRFHLFDPRETLSVRIVDRERGRESEWMELRKGAGPQALSVRW